MRITIDTKEDTIEDIKKVIGVLSSIIKTKSQEPEDQKNVLGILFQENKEEKRKDKISVIPYE